MKRNAGYGFPAMLMSRADVGKANMESIIANRQILFFMVNKWGFGYKNYSVGE